MFMEAIILKNQYKIKTSVIKQTKEQKLYSLTIKQQMSKVIADKWSALESLPLYHSTISYASVVKGKRNSNNEKDDRLDVSKMTESSKEDDNNKKMSAVYKKRDIKKIKRKKKKKIIVAMIVTAYGQRSQ